jgi:hypothetical protein
MDIPVDQCQVFMLAVTLKLLQVVVTAAAAAAMIPLPGLLMMVLSEQFE